MNLSGEVFQSKLDFWIEKNLNVLFIGKHGVGKTATVEAAFKRNKLNYKYFSAATMDPWVDFLGVPKEKTTNELPEAFQLIKSLAELDFIYARDWVQSNWKLNQEQSEDLVSKIIKAKSGLSYLELIKPYEFATGKIEAIFFDEFNRSPKKVRNAVMELIQFRSINGIKLPSLKVVWAAINPDDDDLYDVEKLDPAQLDRFHVHWEMPYRPDAEWFRKKYGERLADSAIQWWDELPEEEKLKVTPRRLQYALDLYNEEGDIRDVLPITSNVSKLLNNLIGGPILQRLEMLMDKGDTSEAIRFLSNENNCYSSIKIIKNSKTMIDFFLPLLPKEKIAAIIHEDDQICKHVIKMSIEVPIFMKICKQILQTNSDSKLVKKIRRFLTENQDIAYKFADKSEANSEEDLVLHKEQQSFKAMLTTLRNSKCDTVSDRMSIFNEISDSLPEKMTTKEAREILTFLNKMIHLDGDIVIGKDEEDRLVDIEDKFFKVAKHVVQFLSKSVKKEILFTELSYFLQVVGPF